MGRGTSSTASTGHGFCSLPVVLVGARLGIKQDRHPHKIRCGLLEHGKPFLYYTWLIEQCTGEIAARSRQACDKTCTDRVGDAENTTGTTRVLALQDSGNHLRRCKDHVRLQDQQFFRIRLGLFLAGRSVAIVIRMLLLSDHPSLASPCRIPARRA